MSQIPRAIALVFEYFGPLPDRRINRTKFHELSHVIAMALCGVLAGAEGWEGLADFAADKEAWFGRFLPLRRGTPSADTFRRVFSSLEPRAFESCLRQWVQAIAQSFAGEVLAIDGKALRGVIERAGSTTPMQMVHVWATEQRLLLAQRRAEGAPGEVAAIPELLKLLDIEGAIVTLDANGCTPSICGAILERAADYVITLKGNRAALHDYAVEAFKAAENRDFRGSKVHRTKDEGHGRRELRVVRTLKADHLPEKLAAHWPGLRTLALVERTRTIRDETTTEQHFYVSSLDQNPERIAHAIRSHWSIENHLHWTLDVAFGEDRQRIRDRNAAENFAVMTRLALMMLKSTRTERKTSLAMKRRKAAWSETFLEHVLTSGISIP